MKMNGRPRKLKHARTITVIVEAETYEKFLDTLPRRVGASEAIRDMMDSQVEEAEKIKNLNSLDQSAIKQINNNLSQDFKISEQNEQPKIDFFCIERADLPKLASNVKDKPTLAFVKAHCKEFIKVIDKRMQYL